MAIKGIDSMHCVGCGQCDQVCPMDVIYFLKERKKPVIQYAIDCQSCFLCQLYCPADCIEVTAERARTV